MMAWLSLIGFAASASQAPCCDVAQGPVAQARLAAALAGADEIEAMAVSPAAADRPLRVTFTVARGGALTRITATAGRDGAIESLEVAPAGKAPAGEARLTWLAAELADAPAIVRLVDAGRDGVLLSTGDGRRYLVSSGAELPAGNEAVEARWGAEWTTDGAADDCAQAADDAGAGAISARAPARRPVGRAGA